MSVITGNNEYIIQLLISTVFGFLCGLEVYTKTPAENRAYLFGTERTFAFIALLGFIMLKATTIVPYIYITGFIILTLFYLVHYYRKTANGSHGLTIIIIALLVYTFPLIVQIFPFWLAMFILTMILVLLETKEQIKTFADKLYRDDYLTLSKFVILTCVLLPLIPDKEIIEGLPVSPYKLWLAIVAISAISYLGYILRKFVFPKAGLMLTAIIGGLYSSTATTFILAKKSKEALEAPNHYVAAIISATSLMFIRVFVLVVIFNPAICMQVLPLFAIMVGVSAATSFFIYRLSPQVEQKQDLTQVAHQNPLELKVAVVFGILYIVFSLLTKYTIQYFGNRGLNALSFVVGLTDIDPFLLNIFQGKYTGLSVGVVTAATVQAIASNNILKMIYAMSLGEKNTRKYLLLGFGIIIACNLLLLLFI